MNATSVGLHETVETDATSSTATRCSPEAVQPTQSIPGPFGVSTGKIRSEGGE